MTLDDTAKKNIKKKMNQGLDISLYRMTNKEKVHISEMEPNTQGILEEKKYKQLQQLVNKSLG